MIMDAAGYRVPLTEEEIEEQMKDSRDASPTTLGDYLEQRKFETDLSDFLIKTGQVFVEDEDESSKRS